MTTNKLLLIVTVAVLASILSMPAKAARISYQYVDIGYVSYNIAGIPGVAFTGLGLAGSFEVNENFNVAASYLAPQFGGVSVTMMKLGAAYHVPIDNSMHWFAMIDYRSGEVVGFAKGTGYSLSGGVRIASSDQLELEAAMGYASFQGFSGMTINVGAVYKFSDQMGISLGAIYLSSQML